MIIKAKKLSFLRLFGAFLILLGLFSSLFLDYFELDNWILFLFLLIFNLLWLSFSFGLKFEINLLRSNKLKVSIILIILSMIIAIIVIIFNPIASFLFLTIAISNFLLMVCWHYAPSIYKKEKILAIIGGAIYAVYYIIVKLSNLMRLFGLLTALIPILLLFLGIFIIFLMEIIMKKKGFLNYI